MLWLGDWQFHRAVAGNELSWAYTFEWPLFAVLGAVFWVKTAREELRAPGAAGQGDADAGAGVDVDGDGVVSASGTPERPGTGPGPEGAMAGTDPGPEGTMAGTDPGPEGTMAGTGPPARPAADAGATAYAARLRTEVRGHGRWHGLR
jgi:hypothetical protein